jgi:hypothetical protein
MTKDIPWIPGPVTLRVLREHGEPMTVREVAGATAAAIGSPQTYLGIAAFLEALVKRDLVYRVAGGTNVTGGRDYADDAYVAKPPSLVEGGVNYDAYCIECAEGTGTEAIFRRVERRFGAWVCPVHRDEGHVDFHAWETSAPEVTS